MKLWPIRIEQAVHHFAQSAGDNGRIPSPRAFGEAGRHKESL
jgi:hypothetical protein